MFNLFDKSIESKINKLTSLQQKSKEIIVERDLMIDNYNQISKAISSFDFDSKGIFKEQKYYDDKYIKDLANFKYKQQSINKKISDIKGDITKSIKRESGLLGLPKIIVKSLYKDGKIGLEDYEKNISSKTKKGQTKYSDCIVLNNKNQILLLKRSMWEDNHKGAWVIPGGHVDKGEDFETAGKRELFEESGISLDKITSNFPILKPYWSEVGIYEDDNVIIHYFCLAGVDDKCVEILLDDAETRDYKWVEVDELDNYDMVFNMKDNIMKVMGWDNYPQVKLIRKAIQMSIIPIERINEINKAMSHKYIRKEVDGKGGWNYIYEEKKEEGAKKDSPKIINEKNELRNLLNDAQIKNSLVFSTTYGSQYWDINGKGYRVADHDKKDDSIYKLGVNDFRSVQDLYDYLKSNTDLDFSDKTEIEKEYREQVKKYITTRKDGLLVTPNGSLFDDIDNATTHMWRNKVKFPSEREDINKSTSDAIHGGKSDGKTLEDIAKKHNISLEEIEKQYKLGLKIEREHTDNEEQAGEIAKDHLWENDKYYIDSKPKDWAEKELKVEEIEKAFVNISELFVKGEIEEDIYNLAKEKYDIYKSKKDFEESIYKKENND